MELTHFNENGRAKMVDIGEKVDTNRSAYAVGKVFAKQETIEKINDGNIEKGDVLAVAQVAGIMAAKKTSDIIPMCHNIGLTGVNIEFEIQKTYIEIACEVKTFGKTGAEMEALTAVSVTALTIYDMCKAVDKEMIIGEIALVKKTGGKSGDFIREIGGK